jgi:2-(1,2-epoxy-1,2-dihydrophenyl)acetyl-CoA isomerase
MSESVELSTDGGTARVLLNRPDDYNALDPGLLGLLADVMVDLAVDDGIRTVIISGAGKAFCSGGDLKWAQAHPDGLATAFNILISRFHQVILEIRRMRKPVIAAINGVAAGGGFSLAIACDFSVMAESAVMKQAYTSSGLSMDGAGSFMLPRLVGQARALEIMAFDDLIPSERALAWGLVNRVTGDGNVLDEAGKMAEQLGARSTNSFGCSKQLVTDAFSTPLEAHMERERSCLIQCVRHGDGQEGLAAFVAKRKPVFSA